MWELDLQADYGHRRRGLDTESTRRYYPEALGLPLTEIDNSDIPNTFSWWHIATAYRLWDFIAHKQSSCALLPGLHGPSTRRVLLHHPSRKLPKRQPCLQIHHLVQIWLREHRQCIPRNSPLTATLHIRHIDSSDKMRHGLEPARCDEFEGFAGLEGQRVPWDCDFVDLL